MLTAFKPGKVWKPFTVCFPSKLKENFLHAFEDDWGVKVFTKIFRERSLEQATPHLQSGAASKKQQVLPNTLQTIWNHYLRKTWYSPTNTEIVIRLVKPILLIFPSQGHMKYSHLHYVLFCAITWCNCLVFPIPVNSFFLYRKFRQDVPFPLQKPLTSLKILWLFYRHKEKIIWVVALGSFSNQAHYSWENKGLCFWQKMVLVVSLGANWVILSCIDNAGMGWPLLLGVK